MAIIKDGKVVSNKEAIKRREKNLVKRRATLKGVSCYFISPKVYHLHDGVVLEDKGATCVVEWTNRNKAHRGQKHVEEVATATMSFNKN